MPLTTRLLDSAGAEIEVRNPAACASARTPRSRCRYCVDSCPHQAITLTRQGPSISTERCSGCSLCLSACPNEVLTWKDRRDLARMLVLEAQKGNCSELYFACSRAVNTSRADKFAQLMCVAEIDVAFLVAAARAQCSQIMVEVVDCKACPYQDGLRMEQRAEEVFEKLRVLFSLPGLTVSKIKTLPARSGVAVDQTRKKISRRRFLRLRAKNLGNGVMHTCEENQMPAPLEAAANVSGILAKRRRWLEAVKARQDEGTLQSDFSGLPFAEVRVNSLTCWGCIVCSQICPTAALDRVAEGNLLKLVFTAALCTGCGLCAEQCLPKAITLHYNLSATHFKGPSKPVFEAAAVPCRRCGELTPQKESASLCIFCAKSQRRNYSLCQDLVEPLTKRAHA